LVDRIITAKPRDGFLTPIENKLGYADNLLITSEDYALWSIEGNDHVKEILSFEPADHRVMIKPDIDLHRELKLRLLNGTHTLSCGVAFLAGAETVKEAMEDKTVSSYITNLMLNEIANAIPYEVESSVVHDFASTVLNRFCNPYLMHTWLSIAQNYSAKMKFRCLPILVKHYENSDEVPEAIALGFASYIIFMKSVAKNNEKYYVQLNGENYSIEDEQSEVYFKFWNGLGPTSLAQVVLSDAFWGIDLLSLPGFKQSVTEKLNLIMNNGMKEAIESIPSKKVKAA
jgi:tagaturonate reductase